MNPHTQEEGHGSRHTGPGIGESSYNTPNGVYKCQQIEGATLWHCIRTSTYQYV